MIVFGFLDSERKEVREGWGSIEGKVGEAFREGYI